MKKFMKVATVMMAMATVGSTLAGCSSAKSEGNNPGKTIKIGVNMELSGAAGAYGQAEKQGIALAAQEINKTGGIKVGKTKKKIQMVYRDNKTSSSESSSVAAQLVNNDKAVAVIGPATTNAGTAAIPNITKAKVAAISPSASDYSYTLQKSGKVQPYVFRTEYQNNFQGKIVSNFISKNLNAKRVVIMADKSTDYATGLAKEFKKDYPGTIVKTEYFQSGDKDFNAALTSIKSKKYDAIFVPGYYSEVGLIVKQARQMGINQPIVGTDGMADPKLVQIAGKSNATNVYYTTPFSTTAAASDTKASAFVKSFKSKYHEDAPTFSALGYDTVYMVKKAIETQKSANSVQIAKGLAKIKNFHGVSGTITIDKKHNPQKTIAIEQLKDGKVAKAFTVK